MTKSGLFTLFDPIRDYSAMESELFGTILQWNQDYSRLLRNGIRTIRDYSAMESAFLTHTSASCCLLLIGGDREPSLVSLSSLLLIGRDREPSLVSLPCLPNVPKVGVHLAPSIGIPFSSRMMLSDTILYLPVLRKYLTHTSNLLFMVIA